MDEKIKEILPIFEALPEVKLVYLFGSKATGKAGPLSDYDLAIFAAGSGREAFLELKLKLLIEISKTLKTDAVDIVILNLVESPELKYNIIKEGEIIFEREPYKILIEPRILNEYFDFRAMLRRHNLTRT